MANFKNFFCFSDDRSQTVLPLVKSFCEKSFKADESILVSLSFHLGKLCNGLYGMIQHSFKKNVKNEGRLENWKISRFECIK